MEDSQLPREWTILHAPSGYVVLEGPAKQVVPVGTTYRVIDKLEFEKLFKGYLRLKKEIMELRGEEGDDGKAKH